MFRCAFNLMKEGIGEKWGIGGKGVLESVSGIVSSRTLKNRRSFLENYICFQFVLKIMGSFIIRDFVKI